MGISSGPGCPRSFSLEKSRTARFLPGYIRRGTALESLELPKAPEWSRSSERNHAMHERGKDVFIGSLPGIIRYSSKSSKRDQAEKYSGMRYPGRCGLAFRTIASTSVQIKYRRGWSHLYGNRPKYLRRWTTFTLPPQSALAAGCAYFRSDVCITPLPEGRSSGKLDNWHLVILRKQVAGSRIPMAGSSRDGSESSRHSL